MSALIALDIRRLVGLSTRQFIFNLGLKSLNSPHSTPNLHLTNHFSSKPQASNVTIPNILTSLRIGSIPLIVSLIIKQDLLSAAMLAAVMGLTDAADGYIARRFPSQQSVAGSYLDPLADKLFISSLSVALAYSNLLPGTFALNTAVQITTVFCSLMAPLLNLQDNPALPALWLTAASTTIYSGVGYAQSFPGFLDEAFRISASKKK
ncbi:unnamed protein product [Taenia asiatica]|uniref:cardiolipin synthase (CMP-forming) n=1 Tax=Taenia asiatica TaxID=60517 RepID=A0A0R3W0L5_TAEAS|nr:unnamed protein product [Taenia asiatica]